MSSQRFFYTCTLRKRGLVYFEITFISFIYNNDLMVVIAEGADQAPETTSLPMWRIVLDASLTETLILIKAP